MTQQEMVNSLLPEHISEKAMDDLVSVIYERLMSDPEIKDALEASEMQPTSRAASLAAMNCAYTLLAHELGQGVAMEEAAEAVTYSEGEQAA